MHLKLSAAKDDRQNSTVTTIKAETIAACNASLSTLISQLFREMLVTSPSFLFLFHSLGVNSYLFRHILMSCTHINLALMSRCQKNKRIVNRKGAVSIVQRWLARYCWHRDKTSAVFFLWVYKCFISAFLCAWQRFSTSKKCHVDAYHLYRLPCTPQINALTPSLVLISSWI